jgi:PHD/YefM family antitoxin component YafN of YafNO toxin-antitoxin module
MSIQEAIKLLRNSGSGDDLLNMLDKLATQLTSTTYSEPTLDQIDF